jgi:hypothetical protein
MMEGIRLSEGDRLGLVVALTDAKELLLSESWTDEALACDKYIALLSRDQAPEVCECKESEPVCYELSYKECANCGKRIKGLI